MKDTEFKEIMTFKVINEVMYPTNNKARDFLLLMDKQEVCMKNNTPRDVAFHKSYFLFCGWLWEQMPTKFKLDYCPDKQQMYNFLKIVQGKYKFAMKFKGKEFYMIDSISFGRMSDDKFNEFVNEQIHIIYTELLMPLGKEHLLEEAENEFKSLFKKLI
jgi:hypothetical protein